MLGTGTGAVAWATGADSFSHRAVREQPVEWVVRQAAVTAANVQHSQPVFLCCHSQPAGPPAAALTVSRNQASHTQLGADPLGLGFGALERKEKGRR